MRINPDKARQVILDLSTYLRYTIETGNRSISIEKELEQVKAYIGIEEARFYNKFNVHYDIEEGVENVMIPSLTIQPLVENAIQHGILKSNNIGNIYISIFRDSDEHVSIVVEDDGVGIEEDVVEDFDNPITALNFLQNQNIDVAFLDINMPNLDGMSLGKLIMKFKNPPKIVFITAYASYAVDAFGIHAFDYIMKPYSEERIKDTLDRLSNKAISIENKMACKTDKISLWKGDSIHVVPMESIIYYEACERETKVFTDRDIFICRDKISDLERVLPNKKFYRTHRSYIVNIDKIIEIIPWFNSTYNFKLEGVESRVPVSRSKIKDFQGLMGIKR